jgi:hypothetical protein
MNNTDAINKILALEEQIRNKQFSKFSAHTLVPISLVITIIGASVGFGVLIQKVNTLEAQISEVKQDFKGIVLELKSDVKDLKIQIEDLKNVIIKNK